ncbi:YeeE/YedE family protein [Pelagibius litoralis]|uniref:YeeE/YedE family protein n=1 Tax=Pelagibius litoralis TaxID=374515 RepID=A0A967KA85_9PROT|nr:YeeE/YedE family protein [Pelagibius litoralis]NIA69719.1 YeeE/YedE family protein [Pelagibius litoralis]
MGDISTSLLLAGCGLLAGLVVGAVARGARFCTFGAIEDWILAEDTRRLRSWALAIAVAMIIVQFLDAWGVARIDQSFYLSSDFGWAGAIVGGLLFGFGMAMVGTCGYGTLVRLGGGDLRAFVVFLVLGLTAYMTARGLTGILRESLIEPLNWDLKGIGGQGFSHLLSDVLEIDRSLAGLVIGGAVSLVIFWWCFRSAGFRSARRDIAAGVVIGIVVASGFAATGIVGADPFEPQQVESLSYVLPPGETIVYLLTFSGASIDFGVGLVLGTIAGAFLTAAAKGELRLEAFDDAREMRRHLLGAFLMGFGGVTALGCTVGQGISGMATLSMSAPLALGSIFLGAAFGLHYLVSGGVREAISALYFTGREPFG